MWVIPEDYKLTDELLEHAIAFHGHECPAMPLGLRAGLLAMKLLGVKRSGDKQLHAILETGPAHAMACFGDGIQFTTGCTFGKGNLESIKHAKLAVTLVDKATKKAARVVVKPEIIKMIGESRFAAKRKSGVPADEIEKELADEILNKVLSHSDDELFKYEVTTYEKDFPKGTFRNYICPVCGELFFEPGAVVKDGQIVCKRCAAKM